MSGDTIVLQIEEDSTCLLETFVADLAECFIAEAILTDRLLVKPFHEMHLADLRRFQIKPAPEPGVYLHPTETDTLVTVSAEGTAMSEDIPEPDTTGELISEGSGSKLQPTLCKAEQLDKAATEALLWPTKDDATGVKLNVREEYPSLAPVPLSRKLGGSPEPRESRTGTLKTRSRFYHI
ncbi:hypothetical protein C8J56DRAFT_899353 [Mycena floridula]|nr:hypothetical protein C8J56DRAFT_900829 [Mycena floridula]KAJ7577279.1 hypothetical protein C8J56DRAFT_899353 [Mycena floridula]